ncbi:GNAT family N-acetyltransferase [Streptomyces xiamenensis]|uniref:GNAT family N-acetyltransferase n=1 Tax=Streptomyces xiamenensis TaxID=408015 RepID=UPI0036E16605
MASSCTGSRASTPSSYGNCAADQSLAGYLDALDGETVWISHIGIDPRYRGLGHATRLLKAVFEHSPEKTISLAAAYFPAWREPGLTHDQLHDWYTRHGFRPDPAPGDPHRMTRLPVRAPA